MANIFSWLGQKIGLTTPGFWSAYYGGDTWAGEAISAETAMQISTFWSCVRLIAQTIGTLPIGVYQKPDPGNRGTPNDNGRTLRDDLDLYRLIHDQPSADHTAVEFWEGVAACLCLAGNSFAEKSMQGSRLIALTLLNPAFMNPLRNNDGALIYRYSDPKGARDYTEDQIFHVRGFGIGGDVGLSPIHYARQSLAAFRATERAAATTFANGMRPSGWLVYKGGTLRAEQREQAKKTLIEPMQGAENAGKTGILEGDFDYRQMTIPPETAQLLQTRSFGVEEVCRWMGVPPILVGHNLPGHTMYGGGVEQVFIGWYTLGLRPYLTRIEQAVKRSLIAAADKPNLYVEFSLEGLLRADSAARGDFYWKLAQLGALTPNQICEKENMPKFAGGDVHYLNTTLAPLDENGLPLKAAVPAPLLPDGPAEDSPGSTPVPTPGKGKSANPPPATPGPQSRAPKLEVVR